MPNKLTSLGNGAFEYCNAEIIFPASLKYIPIMGDNAVTKVTIPEGVKMIGEEAFAYCSNFTEITLPSTITNIERSAFFNTPITEFVYPQNIDNIPASAFGGTKLTEFSVPDNVKEIDDGAFYKNDNIKSIYLPDSVKKIGDEAFGDMKNLQSIRFSNSIKELDYAIFNKCKKLTTVKLPKKIQTIRGTFGGKKNCYLKKVYINATSLKKCNLKSIPKTCKIYVKNKKVKQQVKGAGFKGKILIC